MCAAPRVTKDFENLKSPSELDGLPELLASENVNDVSLELQTISRDKPQLIRFLTSPSLKGLAALEIDCDEPLPLDVIPSFGQLSQIEQLHFHSYCLLDAQLEALLKLSFPNLTGLGLLNSGISVEGASLLAGSALGAQLRHLTVLGLDTASVELLTGLPHLEQVHLFGVAPSKALDAQLAALRLRGADVLFNAAPARPPAPTRDELAARVEAILAEPPSFTTFHRLLDTLVYCDDERYVREFQSRCEKVVNRWPIESREYDPHRVGFWVRPCASLVKVWSLSDFSVPLLRQDMVGPALPGITHLRVHFNSADPIATFDWRRFTGLEEVILHPQLDTATPAMMDSWRFPSSVTRVDVSHSARYWFDGPRSFFQLVEKLKRAFPGLMKVNLGGGWWVEEHNALSGGRNVIKDGWLELGVPPGR